MRIAVACVLGAVLVGGCQDFPAASGISREQAIELALRAGIPLEQAVVTRAREGTLRALRVNESGEPGPGIDLNEVVWQVTLEGIWTVCPPVRGGECRRFKATTHVYLDHGTGAFLFSETGAPAVPADP